MRSLKDRTEHDFFAFNPLGAHIHQKLKTEGVQGNGLSFWISSIQSAWIPNLPNTQRNVQTPESPGFWDLRVRHQGIHMHQIYSAEN